MIHTTKRCPYCNAFLDYHTDLKGVLGFPFRKCTSCGKMYLDSEIKEFEMMTPEEREAYLLTGNFQYTRKWYLAWTIVCVIVGIIMLICCISLATDSSNNGGWISGLIFIIALFACASLCGYKIYRLKKKGEEKIYNQDVIASIIRTHTPEYRTILKQNKIYLYPVNFYKCYLRKMDGSYISLSQYFSLEENKNEKEINVENKSTFCLIYDKGLIFFRNVFLSKEELKKEFNLVSEPISFDIVGAKYTAIANDSTIILFRGTFDNPQDVKEDDQNILDFTFKDKIKITRKEASVSIEEKTYSDSLPIKDEVNKDNAVQTNDSFYAVIFENNDFVIKKIALNNDSLRKISTKFSLDRFQNLSKNDVNYFFQVDNDKAILLRGGKENNFLNVELNDIDILKNILSY